jgi:hypothetical protein
VSGAAVVDDLGFICVLLEAIQEIVVSNVNEYAVAVQINPAVKDSWTRNVRLVNPYARPRPVHSTAARAPAIYLPHFTSYSGRIKVICCPSCPRDISISGVNLHRKRCSKYLEYTKACLSLSTGGLPMQRKQKHYSNSKSEDYIVHRDRWTFTLY